jgi:regulator of replication initiation timing
MQAELQVLEAQYKGLQTLVGELLLTNQKLRAEVAELRQKTEPSAKATLPPPRPDR